MQKTVRDFEEKTGYVFKDKNLILTAFTHSSFSNEKKAKGEDVRCNERLEFLGDSVLSLIASVYLFKENRNLFEGDLTKIRAGIVCENALYEYAKEIDLGSFLLLGKGEENTGGRERKSILADAFEATIAAIYLDGGFEKAREYVLPFISAAAEKLIGNGSTEDYKTVLQKFIQQGRGDILEYTTVSESGPSHNKIFEVQVTLNNNVIGRGSGYSKREAEQQAAKEALSLFGDIKL
ncbi:MAG: ribonuclease III [Clostridia bacterium]|nr:ribonuclease III [Clostridia bacterium]